MPPSRLRILYPLESSPCGKQILGHSNPSSITILSSVSTVLWEGTCPCIQFQIATILDSLSSDPYPITCPLGGAHMLKPATSVNAHSMTGPLESLKSWGAEIRTNRLDRSQALVLCLSEELLRMTNMIRPICGPIYLLHSIRRGRHGCWEGNGCSVQKKEWAYEMVYVTECEEMLSLIYCGLWNQRKWVTSYFAI